MADRNLYDEDILAWSDQQAAALRRLATLPGLPNELDLEHIARRSRMLGTANCAMLRICCNAFWSSSS